MTPTPPRLTPPEILQRAIAAYQSGNAAEAERLCEAVLGADARNADAVNLLGAIEMGRGNANAALGHFTRAAQLQPRFADSHSNRGVALQALERWEEALACFRRALEIDPRHVDALYNRGVVLGLLKRWNEALDSYDRVLRASPGNARAWNNRGNVLQELDRWPEALQSYERALQLRGEHPELLVNRGIALLELARTRDALASFERAAALDPGFREAQWCRSMTYLTLGDLARGWPLYEWRWQRKDAAPRRHAAAPLWRGEAPAGKTLLLHAEEGYGDAIHMARFAPIVEARGARVLLEVYAPLARLMTALSPSIEVFAHGAALPAFDAQCPLGSIPGALGTTLDTIPGAAYLRAFPSDVDAWAARLGERSRRRIGLAWSGNAAFERDRQRSLAFERLLPLLGADPDAEFHCVQKDLRPADRAAIERDGRVRIWSDAFSDFAETAGLIANLDLVISVDTSVAHLSAAMGKPTWILLALIADQRWLLERTDSPWYPSARLFRQRARGDWNSVIAEAAEALRAPPA